VTSSYTLFSGTLKFLNVISIGLNILPAIMCIKM